MLQASTPPESAGSDREEYYTVEHRNLNDHIEHHRMWRGTDSRYYYEEAVAVCSQRFEFSQRHDSGWEFRVRRITTETVYVPGQSTIPPVGS